MKPEDRGLRSACEPGGSVGVAPAPAAPVGGLRSRVEEDEIEAGASGGRTVARLGEVGVESFAAATAMPREGCPVETTVTVEGAEWPGSVGGERGTDEAAADARWGK